MDELRLVGNCLKGSRPLLSFSQEFDSSTHWSLIKELLTQIFGLPRGARRSKPFLDHVYTFSLLDGKVWFTNHQIIEKDPAAGIQSKEAPVVEIGPRFVLEPIRIFEGSMGGPTLWESPLYTAPTEARRLDKQEQSEKYRARRVAQFAQKEKQKAWAGKDDPLADSRVFA